jgi:hypothetical protein
MFLLKTISSQLAHEHFEIREVIIPWQLENFDLLNDRTTNYPHYPDHQDTKLEIIDLKFKVSVAFTRTPPRTEPTSGNLNGNV